MVRIFSNIAIFLSIFFLPPYLSILLAIIGIFIFDNFAESIFWAFLLDMIHSGGLTFGARFNYVFTLIVIIIFLLSFRMKKMIKFYGR